MPRFDDNKRILRCAVRDLLDADPESPGLTGGSMIARARAGTRVHAEARAAVSNRQPVDAEYSVEWHFSRPDGWRVELEGRIDLLVKTPGGLEVIEVKSTFLNASEFGEMTPPRSHREQCGIYCLMLVRGGRCVHRGRLRYHSLTDDSQFDVDIGFDARVVQSLVEQRLDDLMLEHGRALERAGRKKALGKTLSFPFEGQRAGQDVMIEKIALTVETGGILFCSAPTGIGKTAAALFPMVRAALDGDMRLFFVTAKISQQELAIETLHKLIPPGQGVCALQLKARERSCPVAEMRCDPHDCSYLEDFSVRLERSGILDQLEKLGTVAGDTLTNTATAARLCPFEVSVALARRAAVIVSDYNYVFHTRLALKSLFDDPTALPMLLVVDEAHNLPERVRGYYSPELHNPELRRLAKLCGGQESDVYRAVARLLTEVADACDERIATLRAEQGDQEVWSADPDRCFFEKIVERTENLVMEYLEFRRRQRRRRPPAGLEPQPCEGSRRFRDPVLNACFAIRDYADCCRYDPELFAGLWYPDGTARIWCLDPAPFVRQRLDLFNGATLMSATLNPFDFFLRMTGLREQEVALLDLPSPFPPQNRLIAAVPSVDTRYRQRDRAAPAIADIIERTIRLRPGNYLAFFPSFAFRDQVMAAMRPGAYRAVLQTPAMNTLDVLEELEGNMLETILLCAVQGGVFAEGVDYPGHLAVGAFIIGPGLPKICPEQELIRAYHDQQAGDGFRHAYLYPGLNRVVQAGGRIIRSEADRGFILLLDRRLASAGYRSKMPGWWRNELQVVTDPVAAVQNFWAG